MFVYVFAKNSKSTLGPRETLVMKAHAKEILALSDTQMEKSVADGVFREVER